MLLILFETLLKMLFAPSKVVSLIKTLNVGSMAHSTGKTMVTNVLSMDKDDVATFEKCVILSWLDNRSAKWL